ncbi:MAG: exosome complex component RRP41-like protein [Amphiamblys sp. WSBS2006]|nr:MAG: exosome complex component RRP41-like protein [Amphiamblys sp. WSBS2006]
MCFLKPERTFSPIIKNTGEEGIDAKTDKREPDAGGLMLAAGTVGRADGSSSLSLENGPMVVCSVHGPQRWAENERGNKEWVSADKCILEISFELAQFSQGSHHRKNSADEKYERRCSWMLRKAIEQCVRQEEYPQSTIRLCVYVLQGGKSFRTLAAAINCAAVCLIDSGIALNDIVTASSLGDGSVTGNASGVMAWSNRQEIQTLFYFAGGYFPDCLLECLLECKKVHSVICEFYKQKLCLE